MSATASWFPWVAQPAMMAVRQAADAEPDDAALGRAVRAIITKAEADHAQWKLAAAAVPLPSRVTDNPSHDFWPERNGGMLTWDEEGKGNG